MSPPRKDIWSLTQTFTYDAVGNRTLVQDSLGGVTTSGGQRGHSLFPGQLPWAPTSGSTTPRSGWDWRQVVALLAGCGSEYKRWKETASYFWIWNSESPHCIFPFKPFEWQSMELEMNMRFSCSLVLIIVPFFSLNHEIRGNGLEQKLNLQFILNDEIGEIQRRIRTSKTKEGDEECFRFLRELMKVDKVNQPPKVLLSASTIIDDRGFRFESVCDPFIIGITACTFDLPGTGMASGKLTAKVNNATIVKAFRPNLDIAHFHLAIRIDIKVKEKSITRTIVSKDRFVLYNRPTDPDRAYFLTESNEITSRTSKVMPLGE